MKNSYSRFLLLISLLFFNPLLQATASQYLYVPIDNNQISIRDAKTGKEVKKISMDITNPPTNSEPIKASIDENGNPVIGYITIIGDEDEIEVYSANKDKIIIRSFDKKHQNTIILDALDSSLDSYRSIRGLFLIRIRSRGRGRGRIITPSFNFISKECAVANCQDKVNVRSRNLNVERIVLSATADENSSIDDLTCTHKKAENQDYQHVLDCTAQFNLINTCKNKKFNDKLETRMISSEAHITETTATFSGGIYVDTEDYDPEKDVEYQTDSIVNVCGIIGVTEHSGQKADILAVAMKPNVFYMLEEGNSDDFQKVWDHNLANLYAFQKNVTLSEREHKVNIYRGRLNQGSWYIFFGYRLEDRSITFNIEPLKIQIED